VKVDSTILAVVEVTFRDMCPLSTGLGLSTGPSPSFSPGPDSGGAAPTGEMPPATGPGVVYDPRTVSDVPISWYPGSVLP
jgi:hypothetical protein